jgi:succinylarginine dihydrolase
LSCNSTGSSEELHADDLADPALARSVREALQELTGLLEIGPVYPFQA